jgi:hypothetical protein
MVGMERSALRTRTLLVAQCLILIGVDLLTPSHWRYFSAFWPHGLEGHPAFLTSLALIPGIILIAGLFPASHFVYLSVTLLIAGLSSPLTASVAAAFLLFLFFAAPIARDRALVTATWIGLIFAALVWSNATIFQKESPPPLLWFSIMLHTAWGLKSLAWVVSIRSYQMQFTFKQFATYFFHPSFMMFTNDLSVLTPGKFLQAKAKAMDDDPKQSETKWTESLSLLVGGLALIFIYAGCQNLYFKQLSTIGILSHPVLGGVLSVLTAIVFHWANVSIQSSFLRAEGICIPVDMNKPWQARSPSDYWRRMHFYVREYILEILVKPLMTYAIRSGLKVHFSKALLLFLLFAGFTYTQIGYQPFRSDRGTHVGLLITGLFFMITVLPEILPGSIRSRLFEGASWKTRAVLWLSLISVYAAIFKLRVGF